MEEIIDVLYKKYYHVYTNICGYLNFLPRPFNNRSNFCYPYTCGSCNNLVNDVFILLLSYFPRFRSRKYLVVGFCSKNCYDLFELEYKSDMNMTRIYIRYSKMNLEYLYKFKECFSSKQLLNFKSCASANSMRLFNRMNAYGESVYMIKHDNLYLDFCKVNRLFYDLCEIFDVDFIPYRKLNKK